MGAVKNLNANGYRAIDRLPRLEKLAPFSAINIGRATAKNPIGRPYIMYRINKIAIPIFSERFRGMCAGVFLFFKLGSLSNKSSFIIFFFGS